jgi:hypothetical protein
MASIDYGMPAAVQLLYLPSAQALQAGGRKFWNGTFAGAVRFVMALPTEERGSASISLEQDAGLGKTWLEIGDIEAVSRRRDFPPLDD